jgi:hypothetical protein
MEEIHSTATRNAQMLLKATDVPEAKTKIPPAKKAQLPLKPRY